MGLGKQKSGGRRRGLQGVGLGRVKGSESEKDKKKLLSPQAITGFANDI